MELQGYFWKILKLTRVLVWIACLEKWTVFIDYKYSLLLALYDRSNFFEPIHTI